MKIHEIREKETAALKDDINRIQIQMMKLRMENAIGTAESPILLRELRRTIARIKTVLTERERQTK